MFEIIFSWLYTFGFILVWLLAALVLVAAAYLVILIPASIFCGKWYEKMGIKPDGWAIFISSILAIFVAWNVMTLPAYCPDRAIYSGKKHAFMWHPLHYSTNACKPAFFEDKWLILRVPFLR